MIKKMKRYGAGFLAIALILCGSFADASVSLAAEIEEAEEIVQEEIATGDEGQTPEETVEEGQDVREETAGETEGMPGASYAQTEPSDSPEEVSKEKEPEEEKELKANSFRYMDGEPAVTTQRAYSRAVANAWQKVNGRYISSDGSVIIGAEKKGMDVSEWNGKIDWAKAKADGIEFAIIRCGYGSDKTKYDDKYWQYNVSECERLGIPYGVYLYSYADSISYAQSEADHVLRLLKGHYPSLPVYYDLEDDDVFDAGVDMIAKMTQVFCDKVAAAGYRVGIYSSLSWWNNYLTGPVFQNSSWSKWIAQWNNKCTYNGKYDMWQCTSKGRVNGISGDVDLNFWMVKTDDVEPVQVQDSGIISYTSHMQTFGWQDVVPNGYQTGVTGYAKRMEAFKINVGQGYGDLGVRYSAHVQSHGWMDYVTSGQLAGTTGESKRVEALKIELTGSEASKYDIYYRVHSQTYGWLDWAKNGQAAGTQGYAKRLEAIQIAVLPKSAAAPGKTDKPFVKKPMAVTYQTYANGIGWLSAVTDGASSGTMNQARLLEGLKVDITDADYSGDVVYNTYMQSYGWTGEKQDMEAAGLAGSGKRLEAVQVKLTGELAQKYDIYYRTYCQTFGWLGWAKNGETAGTMDYAKRLEAVEIKLVAKGGAAPGDVSGACRQAKIKYTTHVQTYGWGGYVYDGGASGTTGQAKRLEGIRINLADSSKNQFLQYKTHVQTYGWQDWVTGGSVSGTEGQAKRLEAIQIKLTGEMEAKYDIYYRVHAQTYDWLDWAKNGENAGTEGLAKRLEAIEIVLVEKGGAAPGKTDRPFVK